MNGDWFCWCSSLCLMQCKVFVWGHFEHLCNNTWLSTDLCSRFVQMRHQGLHPCLLSHQISAFLPLYICLSSQLHTPFIVVPFLYPFSLPFSKGPALIFEFTLALELNVLFSNLISVVPREARNSLCLFLDLASLAIVQSSSQEFWGSVCAVSHLLSCCGWACAQQPQLHQSGLHCAALICGSIVLLSSLSRHHSVLFPDIFLLIKLLKGKLIRRQSQGGFGLEILFQILCTQGWILMGMNV